MTKQSHQYDTIVIGGGQAGLATGYYLKKQNRDFAILDARERIGDSWRRRWDTLRLFTPARYNGLPGMPFPSPAHTFPTKDDMADFLEAYAAEFDLPVRMGYKVNKLSKVGTDFRIVSNGQQFESRNVVVATGAYQIPRTPEFAGELDSGIRQLHSSEYRNPSQLQEGAVLVVGAGNSGADIALEVSREHHTILSGRNTGAIPFRIDNPVLGRIFLVFLDLAARYVLNVDTPVGRKVRPYFQSHGAPVVWVKPSDLEAAGVERVFNKTVSVQNGKPVLDNGQVLDVANVIWCTGFRKDFGWIDLPIFGEDDSPEQYRGVVSSVPGLYFMGLVFQYSESSSVVSGVGRDARYVADHIAGRSPATEIYETASFAASQLRGT